MSFDHQKSEYGYGFGFLIGYCASRVWPLEKHLIFRLYWGRHNLALEFNPTRKEIDRAHS